MSWRKYLRDQLLYLAWAVALAVAMTGVYALLLVILGRPLW